MKESRKPGRGGVLFGTPRRRGLAAAAAALALTLLSYLGICTLVLHTYPAFLPPSWPYQWVVEILLLWCVPFFLLVWRLTSAVLEERFGETVRDTLDQPVR